jgi:hypothetical protein
MLRLSDARNFGRTMTGLCLIGAPAALLLAQIVTPDIDDDNKAVELQNLALHNRKYLVGMLVFLAASVLLLLAAIGLVRLFRGVRVTLGQFAAVLLAIGAAATFGFYAWSSVEYEMTRHNLPRAAMAKLLDELDNAAVLAPIWIIFLIGVVLGSVLLALAAWRRRLIHPVGALAILAGGVLSAAGQDKTLSVVSFALLLVGLGSLGLAVLRMSDEEWDAPVGAPPVTAPA